MTLNICNIKTVVTNFITVQFKLKLKTLVSNFLLIKKVTGVYNETINTVYAFTQDKILKKKLFNFRLL